MSFRAVYTCDICHEDTLKGNVLGCRFSDLRRFTLSDPESTQGTHICKMCLDQLREQLGPKHPPQEEDRGPHG